MKKKYPLAQLQLIKQKRMEEAERVFIEKKTILAKEEQKLRDAEQKRDDIKTHYDAKLTQLREKLDQGEAADKIIQMKFYLKTVVEKLNIEEKNVDAQKVVVKKAIDQVNVARSAFMQKQKDVEKLKIHYKEWFKEMVHVEELQEALDNDEIGNNRYILRKLGGGQEG